MMTDDQLADFLGLTGTKDRDKIMSAMTPEERAEWEEMAQFCFEIELWDKGVGPLPAGVMVCRPHKGHRHG